MRAWCPACLDKGVMFAGRVVSASGSVRPGSHVAPDGSTHAFEPDAVSVRYRCAMDHDWTETETKNCWCGWSP